MHSIIHSCEDVISWDKYDLQLLFLLITKSMTNGDLVNPVHGNWGQRFLSPLYWSIVFLKHKVKTDFFFRHVSLFHIMIGYNLFTFFHFSSIEQFINIITFLVTIILFTVKDEDLLL